MLIVQISDLHLRTDGVPIKDLVNAEAALAACVDHIQHLTPTPNIVLVTGDLVQKDAPELNYREVHHILDDLPCPWVAIPGNHDERVPMREILSPGGHVPAEGTFLHQVIETYPLRLIGLDTKRDDANEGRLCAERLDWLKARLDEQPDRPTLIFMHHPPFATGVEFLDGHFHKFEGAAELKTLLKGYSNIAGVICGHVHRQVQTCFAGTLATVAPGVQFQMGLDFSPGAQSSLVLEPSSVALYHWSETGGLVAHLSPIGDFGPRYPIDTKARGIMLTLGM
ncbi:phosphodiesterase [Magnetospira thiophila]